MTGRQMALLGFVLMAALINRTLMSPVLTERIAAFDKIARVNEHYGKVFLLSSCHDKWSFSFMFDTVKASERLNVTYSSALQRKKGFIFSALLRELQRFAQALFVWLASPDGLIILWVPFQMLFLLWTLSNTRIWLSKCFCRQRIQELQDIATERPQLAFLHSVTSLNESIQYL